MQNTAFSTKKTLNLSGHLIDVSQPVIMGILNVTPDSFYDGGQFNNEKDILKKAEQIWSEGATIIDIGGYSSRPGAKDISPSEELGRVLPAVRSIRKNFPGLFISVDTFRGEIARAVVGEGASMINDISGGELDKNMADVIRETGAAYVTMHMKGNPQTMTKEAVYEDVVSEVIGYFHKKLFLLGELGIKDIIIDPGFGFSKTREHNFRLLKDLQLFSVFERPLLAGVSRKSMVWKTLEVQPDEALNGTTVLNTIALLKGVNILRVHDVREASEAIKLVNAFNQN